MSTIVITGFMGSGKTTVAASLARRLGCDVIDLDALITERAGHTPAEIISRDGEAVFRQIETQMLRNVLDDNSARVIALGGGAWTITENRRLIAERMCLSVWLDAPFELCWERIIAAAARPLAPDRESAQRLYTARRASYELADFHVLVGARSVDSDLAGQIEAELERQDQPQRHGATET
jgi:shikimate kinase